MSRIFSNSRGGDFVINPFREMILTSRQAHLAAPYFTHAEPLLEAAGNGSKIHLLIGLNEATSPQALRKIHEKPGIIIRYFTSRFHAKIYIFDTTALLGSSNLTDGGLLSNREAVIALDHDHDADAFEDLRALFAELWEQGDVLTPEKLDNFEQLHKQLNSTSTNSETKIEMALGQTQPHNINVTIRRKAKEHIFIERLRRDILEQYGPAFNEVKDTLQEHGLRRVDLADIGIVNETNRFLNYLRLIHASGDDAWQNAEQRPPDARRREVIRYGKEWVTAENNRAPEGYVDWLRTVEETFGTKDAIKSADKDQITDGLIALHAFKNQRRFIKGGQDNLPATFWEENNGDIERVKSSLTHLLHGPGDFIERFHELLYDTSRKLKRFGYFSALELYGTVKPEECPPMNGRMAKALRFLGFDVNTKRA